MITEAFVYNGIVKLQSIFREKEISRMLFIHQASESGREWQNSAEFCFLCFTSVF